MKLTAGDVWVMVPVLVALAAEKLPVVGKYSVTRLVDILGKEYERISKARQELLEQHGTLNEDGKSYMVRLDSGFVAEEAALFAKELETEIAPLKLKELGNEPIQTNLGPLFKLIDPS